MTDFQARLLRTSAALAALIGLFIAGLLTSAERLQARAEEQPLLPIASPAEITGVELVVQGVPRLSLRRQGERWEVRAADPAGAAGPADEAAAGGPAGSGGPAGPEPGGPPAFPAHAGRVEALLGALASLRRGTLVSSDPARDGQLGLAEGAARLLLLHRGGGRPAIGLLVGARGPGGDADYLKVRGETGAYLARGSLSILLAQDRAYWYDLHLLPDEVRGATIGAIRARGRVNLGPTAARAAGDGTDGSAARAAAGGDLLTDYILARKPGASGGPGGAWAIATEAGEEKTVDQAAAGAMASALALLEGEDFLEALPARAAARAALEAPEAGTLEVEVVTLQGRAYSLRVRGAREPGQALVTTSWSPWTYLVNAVPLRRAIRPLSELLAGG